MTIGNYTKKIQALLVALYDEDEVRAIADLLMEHVTGLSRMQRVLNRRNEVSKAQELSITRAMEQLLQFKPIQYVLGETWFMGLKFYVNPFVLIPRPETAELVNHLVSVTERTSTKSILDIGTGSGCIPVALRKQFPVAVISSIDISSDALDIARKNAVANDAFIHFLQLDFLDETSWPVLPVYDIIISNPPYIPLSEKEKLDKNVTDWEPGQALFVPDNDPLLFYKKIARFGKSHLPANGKIFVETHQDYAVETKEMFESYGYFAVLKKDMYENDRIIIASRNMF